MTSFSTKKQLRFVITLGTGKFGSSDNNRIELTGFRATADIDKAGGMMMGTLRARIYGVRQVDMNSITTLMWKPGTRIANTVEVFAINGDVETLVFAGNIINAWADYQNAPDVFLHIQAQAAYFNGLQAVSPLSIKGGISVAVVMARIAKDMGLTFENNNVNVILTDVYLANTLKEQALELSKACNFSLYIDDKTLAITNRYQPRKGLIPEISAQSGLVGYPTFDGIGINFQTLFNPAITFGGAVKLTTDVEQANGEWVVVSVSHRLESEKPGGAWFSTIRGNLNGLAVVRQ
jgi:hypothetical protein